MSESKSIVGTAFQPAALSDEAKTNMDEQLTNIYLHAAIRTRRSLIRYR